jgi:hypothetical protein
VTPARFPRVLQGVGRAVIGDVELLPGRCLRAADIRYRTGARTTAGIGRGIGSLTPQRPQNVNEKSHSQLS